MNVESKKTWNPFHLVYILRIVPTWNEKYPASTYYFQHFIFNSSVGFREATAPEVMKMFCLSKKTQNQTKSNKQTKPSRIIAYDSKFILSLPSWRVVLQRQTGSLVNAIFTQYTRKIWVLERHLWSPTADFPLIHIAANHELLHWIQ